MPHANIWIRKDNEDLWNSIKDKSAWVNDRLKLPRPVVIPKINGTTVISGHSTADIKDALVEQATSAFEGKTCKKGHPSANGKNCFNMKCPYAV